MPSAARVMRMPRAMAAAGQSGRQTRHKPTKRARIWTLTSLRPIRRHERAPRSSIRSRCAGTAHRSRLKLNSGRNSAPLPAREGIALNALAARIDAARGDTGLASAIRLFVLQDALRRAGG